MSERRPYAGTLSVNRAFVVHFGDARDARRRRFAGRAEHLSSGDVALFSSLKELLAFFERVLVADRGAAPQPNPPLRDRK
ncbi:MAG TPA: hypothetical protein VFD92_00520 [Candidatus Binatia bacterium]|nr:hypothetical protein [Candidatus Binatia bacterium]